MIKEINDLNVINSFLEKFEISITELGIYDRYLVFEINHQAVAFLNYSIMYDRSEINYIFVFNDFRNSGKASELFNFLIKLLKEKKIKNITLEVSKTNISAIGFYKKHGFVPVSVRKNYYDGTDGILMIRELE